MRSIRDALRTAEPIHYRDDAADVLFTGDLIRFQLDLQTMIVSRELPPDGGSRVQQLADQAERFHRQNNSKTSAVAAAITRLRGGAPVIRIAHQPNTLAALNIVGLALIAHQAVESVETALGKRPVVVFLALDYDVADDQRFRAAALPGSGPDGVTRLGGAVPQSMRHRIACAVPSPTPALVMGWLQRMRQAALEWRHELRSGGYHVRSREDLRDAHTVISESVCEPYAAFASLPHANTGALSWLVNQWFGLDTLFVPTSWALQGIYRTLLDLVRDALIYEAEHAPDLGAAASDLGIDPPGSASIRTRGLWRTCPSCFRRVPAPILPGNDFSVISWTCIACGLHAEEGIDEWATIPTSVGEVPRIVPSVRLCDILELIAYQLPVGINYAGSAEHLLWSRIAGRHHGPYRGIEFFWEPRSLVDLGRCKLSSRRVQSTSPSALQMIADAFRRGRFPGVFSSLLFAPDEIISLVKADVTVE